MKNQSSLFLILLLLPLLNSCFKTAEQIRREQNLDNMQQEYVGTQKIVADLTMKVKMLQDRLNLTDGMVEEINHQNQTSKQIQEESINSKVDRMQEQVNQLTSTIDAQKITIEELKATNANQKSYLDKVVKLLGQIDPNAKPTTKTSSSKYSEANKLFDSGKKTQAKLLYVELLNEGKISAAQRNVVWYNLGLLNYQNKDYSLALSYFSKIYSKYPRSSLAPKSLFQIGKTLQSLNEKTKSKAAFNELITKYPQSKESGLAKKEL